MTGKKYLRRKRILGVSAIVLAMLLMALPVFSRAAEGPALKTGSQIKAIITSTTDLGYSADENHGLLEQITWDAAANDPGASLISEASETPVYIKASDDKKTIYVYSTADTLLANSDCNQMFYDNSFNLMDNCTNIDGFVTKLDTSQVSGMNNMFGGCKALTQLNVSGFDTSYVTGMASMFQNCNSLTQLDVSGFNTVNVTNMANMFSGCYALADLDLGDMKTGSVQTMQNMFANCSSLEELDLSSFNTSNVTTMLSMFSNCIKLESLDLSSFDTQNVGTFSHMFDTCQSLEYLNLSSFIVMTNEYSVDGMLTGCSNLNIIRTPKSTSVDIVLPDTYYHLLDNGTWEMDGENKKEYTKIPINNTDADPKSMILIKDDAAPTITPSVIITPTPTASPTNSPTGMAFDSPAVSPTVTPESTTSPTVTGSPSVTASPSPSATVSPTVSPQVSPSPVVTVTPIPSPVTTPTPKPTQNTGKGTLVIVDNRADQTGTGQIAATVSNLVGNLKLIIEDDDGADIKKIQPLKKGQILIPYDIYLIDSYGTRYTNFGSCTITLPIPDSLDLTKGTLTVVAAKSSNVLENVSSTKLVKANINCVQFTATHFSEYGLLWTPYTELTGAVSPSVTPSGTTPKTTAEAATAAAKATSSAGGSGLSGSSSSGSSSSSSASSSSGTTSRGYTVVPVAGVKGYSNAKDMPKTGDGDVYRILGAIILFLFGAIELISSIRVKNAE